jgi:CxxC motif-containing protein
MAPRTTVICIGCPLGCRVTVQKDRKGTATLKGAECKQGEKYVLEELRNPVRTLTATIRTGDEAFPLLPVRTSRPVPKTLLQAIMGETATAAVKAPIKAGDVIVENVLKSKADLIATADWPGSGREA